MHLTSLMQQGNNDLGLILWHFENKHIILLLLKMYYNDVLCAIKLKIIIE